MNAEMNGKMNAEILSRKGRKGVGVNDKMNDEMNANTTKKMKEIIKEILSPLAPLTRWQKAKVWAVMVSFALFIMGADSAPLGLGILFVLFALSVALAWKELKMINR